MILHHRKYSNFAFAIFTEFDIGLGTFKEYSVDSIKRTVHLAFHGLFSLLKILFTNSKQYF